MARIHPKITVRRTSPHQSARSTWPPKLIVIHSTESREQKGSSGDLAAIGSWFANPSSQVSSHVCVDGDGHSARYVKNARKAWHCGYYNSASLGIEQIGYASTGPHGWPGPEVHECARWAARWSIRHRIPIRVGQVSGGRVVRSGIVTHAMLGSYGGGHTDPGRYYPLPTMLRRAREYKAALIAAGWKP